MSHKLTSNQTVTYNTETQESGVLEITPNQITYHNDGNDRHYVELMLSVNVSGSNKGVTGIYYNLSETEWNTFYATQSLISTEIYSQQEEAALNYTKIQMDGNWGLTQSDWTYSS